MPSPKGAKHGAIAQAIEHGRVMREEIAFLRSFNMSDVRIAQRLGISVSTLRQYDLREKKGWYER